MRDREAAATSPPGVRTPLAYSVVIPTKDRPRRAVESVEALLRQTRTPERVVVVDASAVPLRLPDEVHDRYRDARVELTVLHTEASTAMQRNKGADLVSTPVVLFVDDDVLLEPGYADTLLRCWEARGLDAVGGMIGSGANVPRQPRRAALLRQLLMVHYVDRHGESTSLRRSGKLRYVYRPSTVVRVPAVGAGATAFRTDLVRRHRFDERFPGYSLGEDLDLSWRLAHDAPILQVPEASFWHDSDPRERRSAQRWHYRGRRETFFRLRRLGHSPVDRLAFAVSVGAETVLALTDSIRTRDLRHVSRYVVGVAGAVREHHHDNLAPPRHGHGHRHGHGQRMERAG